MHMTSAATISESTSIKRRSSWSSDKAAETVEGVSMGVISGVECRLETKQLWDKFHELGTEMIITKSGR